MEDRYSIWPVTRLPRKDHLMRAFTLDSFDTPPGLREDLPSPEVGDDQLRVRVQASSVNPVDAFIAVGVLKGMAEHEFPVVLSRDYAGVIEQAGPAVTGYAPGDEVYGWLLHANPTVHEGSWAELIAVPEGGSVARRPASVDVGHAGAAPLAALTALAASRRPGTGRGRDRASHRGQRRGGQLRGPAGRRRRRHRARPRPGRGPGLSAWPRGRRGPGPQRRHRRRRARAVPRRGRRPARPGLPVPGPAKRATRRWSATAAGSPPASAPPARARAAPTSAPSPAPSRWSA